MVLFVPNYCHKALDSISRSNMYNLIRQKSMPAVGTIVHYWPRIFVGGAALITLYDNQAWAINIFKGMFNVLPGLFDLSLFEFVPVAGLTLVALGIPCVLLGDSVNGILLLLRHNDDKKKQLHHAQTLLTCWKLRNIFNLADFSPFIHRLCPSFFNYLRSISNNFFSEVIDEIISEPPGFLSELTVMTLTNLIFYWGLRTMIKDLKGEPRSWWGGKVESYHLDDRNTSNEK